ncbi:MAG: hypothetical protein M5U05_19610, partial [Anaerolineales bacterium]|nr:hypothetical protein [Anaerolineales bacterium]
RFGRPAPMENVEADYRVLTPRAPVAQLPARTISIPRNTANGMAQPWGMQAQPRPQPTIETVNDMGEHIGVPLNFLFRFLALPTPSRTEWTGKREIYSQCVELCNAQGLLDRQPNGGYKWKPEYPLTSRKQWALQFESDQPIDTEYTDTHAREE